MNNSVKIILYVVLLTVASISGFYALTSFSRLMDRAGDRTSSLEEIDSEKKPALEEPAPAEIPTTNPAPEEVPLGTNAAAVSDALSLLTNQAAATNADAAVTTAATPTSETTPETSATVPTAGGSAKKPGTGSSGGAGRIGLWTALFLLSIIALGFLIASDVSHFMGNRALKTIYNDEGEGVKNPEYEEAEQTWAKGNHLEAIRLMRDYLKKNPREQHVAIRIAEIYEKDLNNNLAAALEYEEVLQHKLTPERWGWAAIHLCNLYFKLNQEQKGYDLLRRIVKEHPQVPAAEKARKRLEQVDGATIEQLDTAPHVSAAPTPAPADPPSNLPPGFRPKK